MPRPKRTKHGTDAAAARQGAAVNESSTPALTTTTLNQSTRFDSVSSDSDGLVRRGAALRRADKVPLDTARIQGTAQTHEVALSGGLGVEDQPNAHRERAFKEDAEEEWGAEVVRMRKAAEQEQLKKHTASTTVAASQDQSKQTGTAPPSAQKFINTPSSLGLAKFKRRPRANSLLSMVQAAVATRENSMIGGREELELSAEDDESLLTLGGLSAQPTPASKDVLEGSSSSRKRKRGEESTANDATVLVRNSTSPPSSPPPARQTRQRYSLQADKPSRRASARTSTVHPTELRVKETVLDHASQEPSLPELRTTTRLSSSVRPHDRGPTTPPRKRPSRAGPRGPRRRRRTPSPVIGTSPLSTPSTSPQRAVDPPAAVQKRRPRRAKPAPRHTVTTQTLKALLPRRHKRNTAFSILADNDQAGSDDDTPVVLEDEEDEEDDEADELARRRPISRISGNTRHEAAARTKASSTRSHTGPKGRKGQENAPFAPSPASPSSSSDAPIPITEDASDIGPAKKHSRRTTSTLARGHDGGQNQSHGRSQRSKGGRRVEKDAGLAAAAAKFAEIDAWDLSFESADLNGGGASSPWR